MVVAQSAGVRRRRRRHRGVPVAGAGRLLERLAQVLAHLVLLLLDDVVARRILQHRANLPNKQYVIFFSIWCHFILYINYDYVFFSFTFHS